MPKKQRWISREAMLVCPWCCERFSSEDVLFVLDQSKPKQLHHADVLGRGTKHKWIFYPPVPLLFPLLLRLHGSGARRCPRCKGELPGKYGAQATRMIGFMGSQSLVEAKEPTGFAAMVSAMFGGARYGKVISAKLQEAGISAVAVTGTQARRLYRIQRTACVLAGQLFQSDSEKRTRQNLAVNMHGLCFVYLVKDTPWMNAPLLKNLMAEANTRKTELDELFAEVQKIIESPESIPGFEAPPSDGSVPPIRWREEHMRRLEIPDSEAAARLRTMYEDFYLRDDLERERSPFTVILDEAELDTAYFRHLKKFLLPDLVFPRYPRAAGKASVGAYHQDTRKVLEALDPLFAHRVQFLFPNYRVYMRPDAAIALEELPCEWKKDIQPTYN